MGATSQDHAAVAPLLARSADIPSGGGEPALVRAAQEGSADAVETLVRRHWDRAHRAAYLVVHDAAAAEDIAQESLLAAIDRLHRFDRRRRFGPWLHRIVVNRAIDWVRARHRRAEVGDAERAGPETPVADASALLSDDVLTALAALDPEDRAVVVLRHLLDYNATEIARMLGVPAATVRTRLRRALARLRPLVEHPEGSAR